MLRTFKSQSELNKMGFFPHHFMKKISLFLPLFLFIGICLSYHNPWRDQKVQRYLASNLNKKVRLPLKPGGSFQYQIYKVYDSRNDLFKAFFGFEKTKLRNVSYRLEKIHQVTLVDVKLWEDSHPVWGLPGWEMVFRKTHSRGPAHVYGFFEDQRSQLPFFVDLTWAPELEKDWDSSITKKPTGINLEPEHIFY